MSRRRHGRPHHGRHRNEAPRPDASATRQAPATPIEAAPVEPVPPVAPAPQEPAQAASIAPPPNHTNGGSGSPVYTNGHDRANGHDRPNGGERQNGCTAPQLRRFIKSRPYVPMHELRRRFAIDGTDDDVTQVDLDGGRVYVGLPAREGSLLGELLRGGEIGYELSFDPLAPIVVGVYPMRPVPRP